MMDGNAQVELSAGTAAWSYSPEPYYGHTLDSNTLQKVVDESMKIGISSFDTALSYSRGESERILGTLLDSYAREDVHISTKFSSWLPFGPEEALEQSLANLGTDYIDLYYLHDASETTDFLHRMMPFLESGVIRAIGLSNHSFAQVKEAQRHLPIAAVQNHISPLYQRSISSGLVNYCTEHDIDLHAYMLLEQGALGGIYGPQHPFPKGSFRDTHYGAHWAEILPLADAIGEVASQFAVSRAAVLAAWAVSLGIRPIIGATKPGQLTEITEGIHAISPAAIEELSRVFSAAGLEIATGWEGLS
ncbi:MAG: aldo/keto reductase [Corynebacterium sp.]|nr:aldo/keto reductase [Corynebacterium sp.]